MNIYDSLLGAVHSEYDVLMLIKKSERGEVSLVRHRDSGTRYIFRHFYGNSEVYQKLLNVSCPNLPQIMEVGEKYLKSSSRQTGRHERNLSAPDFCRSPESFPKPSAVSVLRSECKRRRNPGIIETLRKSPIISQAET